AMEISTSISYAREVVGNKTLLLPQNSEMRLLPMTFAEERNYLEFTHCREFHAQSNLLLGAGADTPATLTKFVPAPSTNPPLAKGVEMTLALITPVKSSTPVGSLITARVAGAVRSHSKIIVPDGATVRGRIRRLEHYDQQGGYFIVALEFNE